MDQRKTFGIEHALGGQPSRELDREPAAGWSVALPSLHGRHGLPARASLKARVNLASNLCSQ
ncbi:MAG: hypothetical protein R2787_08935 [Saprospiraceae bacterium]